MVNLVVIILPSVILKKIKMTFSNSRFVILDKFLSHTKSTVTPSMFWRLFDGTTTTVRKVNINNNMYFSVYLFVIPQYTDQMIKALNLFYVDALKKKKNTSQYKIYTYKNPILMKTNSNMWSSIGIKTYDQYCYNVNVFRITSNCEDGILCVNKCLQKNQILWCGVYHLYRPSNIEMELLLANFFPTDDCQGPFVSLFDQMNESASTIVSTVENVHIMSFHRFHLADHYVEHVSPISCVNLMFNVKNEVIAASLNMCSLNLLPTSTITSTSNYVLDILNKVPKVSIAVVLSSQLAHIETPHSPTDEIAIIAICIKKVNKHRIYFFVNAKYMTNTPSYKLSRDCQRENESDMPFYYIVSQNESDMLTSFINMYCQNNMFTGKHKKNSQTNMFHFIYGKDSINTITSTILDRIFENNLWTQLRQAVGYNSHVFLLNKHAVLIDMLFQTEVATTTTQYKINGLEFDVHELPRCILDHMYISLNEDEYYCIPFEKCHNRHLSFIKEWNKCPNRVYIDDDEIYNRLNSTSLIALARMDDMDLLNTTINICNKLKFNLRDINTVSNLQLSENYIFLHFLRQKIFMCSSVFHGGVAPALLKLPNNFNIVDLLQLDIYNSTTNTNNMFAHFPHTFNSVRKTQIIPILQNATTAIELYSGLNGGWWYTKFGRFSDARYVNFDFSSFYPSIIGTFGLDFCNHCLMTGSELLAFYDRIIHARSTPINDQTFLILNLYSPPPFCQLLKFSNIKNNVNHASVYLIIYMSYYKHIGKNSLISRLMIDSITATRKLHDSKRRISKFLTNSLIGCIGNKHFKYYSKSFQMAVHALGQFVANLVVRFLAHKKNKNKLQICDEMYERVPLDDTNIIKITTDGVLFRVDSGEDIKKLTTDINEFIKEFLLRAFDIRNDYLISMRVDFETDFIFTYIKSSCFYRDINRNSIVGPKNDIEHHVLQKIYNDKMLDDISDYKNLKAACIYMYYWSNKHFSTSSIISIIEYFQKISTRAKEIPSFRLTLTPSNTFGSMVQFFLMTTCEADWIIHPTIKPNNELILNELNFLRNLFLTTLNPTQHNK